MTNDAVISTEGRNLLGQESLSSPELLSRYQKLSPSNPRGTRKPMNPVNPRNRRVRRVRKGHSDYRGHRGTRKNSSGYFVNHIRSVIYHL